MACELPPFAGGGGNNPDPIQYCLYGLAACFASTLAATATSEGVALKTLKVTAMNKVDLRKQLGLSEEPIIQNVRLQVKVESEASGNLIEKIVKLAQKRCPGIECVTRSIPLRVETE